MKPGLKSTGQYLLFLHLICFWLWCHIHCHGAGPRQKWPKSSRKWPKRLQEGSRLQCRSLEFEASSYFKYVNEFVLEVANTISDMLWWGDVRSQPGLLHDGFAKRFRNDSRSFKGKSMENQRSGGGAEDTKQKSNPSARGHEALFLRVMWSACPCMPFCDLLWQMSMCEFRTKGSVMRTLVDADSPEVQQQMGCRRATSVAMWKRPAWASRVEQWSSVAGMENHNVL